MRRFLAIELRRATGVFAAMAWLGLANHCALGLAMVESHGPEPVAVSDCCASNLPGKPAPEKEPATPCCKTLRIVSVAPAEAPAWTARPLFAVAHEELGPALAISLLPATVEFFFLDSGPPHGGSALETLLQRSLPAHAPPALS